LFESQPSLIYKLQKETAETIFIQFFDKHIMYDESYLKLKLPSIELQAISHVGC